MATERYFSSSYQSARVRFRTYAAAVGCQREALAIGGHGPDGEPLTMDVAMLAGASRRRMLIVSSGLHGIEGFTGAALQLALLDALRQGGQPPISILLLHALNPFGFACLRRVDGESIDLNRNFLRPGELYEGAPEHFAEIEALLDLTGMSRRLDWLLPRLLWAVRRYGAPAVKDAVASGQYVSPHGLFYGGAAPSATHRLLAEHLPRWTEDATEVLHVDVHCGLGRWGSHLIIAEHDWGSTGLDWLSRRFGHGRVEPSEPEVGISYHKRGGLGLWVRALLAPRQYDMLTLEFGTYPSLFVLSALRFENRQHHHGGRAGKWLGRLALREVFVPSSARWRRTTAELGRAVLLRALDVCARDGLPPQQA
jgi:Protein of unknown function (DUF2817)